MLDSKMSFFEQIVAAADRARRRLLMGASQSVPLNGAQVWAEALNMEVHRKRLVQVQKQWALQMASAYRTVVAVMVIMGVIPVGLRAKEHKIIYRSESEILREVVAREEH